MNKSDMKLIRSACNQRWNIPSETKDRILKELISLLKSNTLKARDVSAISRCLIAMEAQNQSDQHLEDKNKRLDTGLPTENTTITVEVPKPRQNIEIRN